MTLLETKWWTIKFGYGRVLSALHRKKRATITKKLINSVFYMGEKVISYLRLQ